MIVIHAAWSPDSELFLWGEDSSRPALVGAPHGRLADQPEISAHPFACSPKVLADALSRLDPSVPVVSGSGSEICLTLPSTARGPQASHQLLRPVDDEFDEAVGLHAGSAWTVRGHAVAAGSVLDLAFALPVDPVVGVNVGDSLRFVAETCKLALELAARGRLRAGLLRRDEVWMARWIPVTDDPGDASRIELLGRAMPGLVRAARPTDSPEGVLRDILRVVLDACARDLLAGDVDPADAGQHLGAASVLEAWLAALVSEDPVVVGDRWELAALAERLEDWWYDGERYAARRMFRTCFRLVAPAEAADPVADPGGVVAPAVAPAAGDAEPEDAWRVDILLQSKDDPSVLIPAADVWSGGARMTALGRILEHPQERLLGGLGHALRLWPELEPSLRTATPTSVELTTAGAQHFLTDVAPALEQAGFGVHVPPWWRQPLGIKLQVDREDEWADSTGLFGFDGLCSYEWRVALGDTTLSLAELEALAELKRPLLRTRGRWVALRADDVEAVLRFFAGRRVRGRASAVELLALGRSLEAARPADDPAPAEVDATGWLVELLDGAADRQLAQIAAPASFVGRLRPYQERGLSWLAFLSSLGLGACLADDMGLGKTIQLLALLLAERDRPVAAAGAAARGRRPRRLGPTLLICPMSVAGNWQREAARFAPSLRVHVHHGRERLKDAAFARAVRDADLVITTYALGLRDRELLAAAKWERLVLDEAQNIKTIDSKQTRAIRTITARHRVALTGTPVENRLSELHSIMDFLNPGLLGSAAGFKERLANPIERYREIEATRRLRELTAPFILRRLKTDKAIIDDLPEKIEMRVDCRLTREQATLYQAVVDEMLEQVEQTAGIARAGIVLAALMKLKQVCNHPAHLLKDRSDMPGRSGKLARLEEIIDEALAQGDRALCFTQFAEFGHRLRSHLQERLGREVLFLHGGTPKAARDQMVERFQADDGPSLFVLSLKAGGTGLNLTAANHVIHFDRWWNPAVEDQATDRAFRIGQRKNVQVRKLTCLGTLEERIDILIGEKKELANRVVGNGEAWLTELDTGQLRELVTLSADAVAA